MRILFFEGIYVPQTHALLALPQIQKDRLVFNISSDRHDTLVAYHDPADPGSYAQRGKYYVNDRRINLSPLPDTAAVFRSTFSPNNELFALEISPQTYLELTGQAGTFAELWIFKTKDPSSSYKVIDFQDRFCMYSFRGIDPEFITDSTLAVSMHRDGDSTSPLWEISLDGDIIRQLTMVPPASVKESEVPLDVSYSVESGSIDLKLAEGTATVVVMVDEIGRTVFNSNVAAGNKELRIPTKGLSTGLYIVHVTSGKRTRSISIPYHHP